jgi:CIC family chloride channel protein
MVLEVSGNYSIILPVLVANTFAYLIARGLQPASIFDVLTRQDGLDLPSMEELREEHILRVEDAMQAVPLPLLVDDEPLERALRQVEDSPSENLLVRLSPNGWNSITKQQLRTMVSEGKGALSLRSVLPIRQIPRLHPDHPLDMALRYVNEWPLVPVVSRANFGKVEGVISRDNVLERYQSSEREANKIL